MGKPIRFGGLGNSASRYEVFVTRIQQIAEEKSKPVKDIIDDFISDLKNANNDNYVNKIPGIEIRGGISDELASDMISYLYRIKDRYKQKEKREADQSKRKDKKTKREAEQEELEVKWKDIESTIDTLVSGGSTEIDAINTVLEDVKDRKYNFDSKEKKYMTRKLQERIAQANQREKEAAEEQARQEQIQRKVQETWRGIQAVANRGPRKAGVSESQHWIAIKRKFEEESSNLKDEDVRNQILELFDKAIIEKEDDEYFEEVKCATRDFKSLAFFSVEMMNALYGAGTRKIGSKNMDRFLNLRSELQQTNNEYQQIRRLLNDKSTTARDRKVLEARKAVMDKEIEKKRKEEGR